MAATTSQALIDGVLTELQTHLPAALLAADLPAVAQWCYGQREFVPTTQTPQVQVDLLDYSQPGRFGPDMRRDNSLIVIAVLAAPDEDTLHRYLIGYGDVICGVIEAQISPTAHVASVDASPSFSVRGSSILFRAVAIEFTVVGLIHHAGDA